MIYTLFSLRFFASFAVYLHHLDYNGGLGTIAVSFFFVMAGFTISYGYKDKFCNLNIQQYTKYLFSRFIRIYPVHILAIIILIPMLLLNNEKSGIVSTVLNIFLIQTYLPSGSRVFDYNGVSWFAADILFFYAIAPFLLYLFNKNKIIKNIKHLLLIQACILLVAIGIASIFHNKIQVFKFGWWFIYIYILFSDYLILL